MLSSSKDLEGSGQIEGIHVVVQDIKNLDWLRVLSTTSWCTHFGFDKRIWRYNEKLRVAVGVLLIEGERSRGGVRCLLRVLLCLGLCGAPHQPHWRARGVTWVVCLADCADTRTHTVLERH